MNASLINNEFKEAIKHNQTKHRKYPSNSSTVILKYYHPEVELVKNLNFFNPNNTDLNFRNISFSIPKINKEETTNIFFLKTKKIEKKALNSNLKYENKWDNINFEQGLESKRRALDEKIRELKTEIRDLYNILSTIKRERDDMEFSSDILDNFARFNQEEEKLMRKMSIVGKRMDKLTEVEFEKMSHFKRLMDMKNNKRSDDLKLVKERINGVRESIKRVKEEIQSKQKSLKSFLAESDEIKLQLLEHYHKLLKEGKDTRKEGLVWLIKAIWNLGYKISPAYLPNFLDEQLINYIFNYAVIDIEGKKIKKKLDEAHLKMRAKQENISSTFFGKNLADDVGNRENMEKTSFSKTRSMIRSQATVNGFKTSSSFFDSTQVKSFVDKLKNEDFGNKNLNLKSIQKFVNSPRETIDPESLSFVNEMRENEMKLTKIQGYLDELKKSELNRVSFEFLKRDYSRRFNVCHEEIVSIIVGEDNVANEISKLRREQKKFNDLLSRTRSFNVNEEITKKLKFTVDLPKEKL